MEIICAKCGGQVEVEPRQLGTIITLKVSPCECTEECNKVEDCGHIESAVINKKIHIDVLLNRLNKIRELLDEEED